MELMIAEKKIGIKEYGGQRVVTFSDIDSVHQRADGTASRNFRENRKKFIEGEDYFVLNGDALRKYKRTTNFVGRKINELHLITETGYLMLVKSFTDDLAWSVQRELVNSYFREKTREQPPQRYESESDELKMLKISAKDYAVYYLDKLTLRGQGKALVLLRELARDEEYTQPKVLLVR